MRIPFDSLDGVTWLAYADYAAEAGLKVAAFARRTGESLLRLASVGADPRMVFVDEFRPPRQLPPDARRRMYWVTLRQAKKQNVATHHLLLSPAHFLDPWRHPRLSAKFFRLLWWRASGVPR